MTLKQLEAFHLAATLGSFALAAERAHVTQSSLSKRIAELEEWAGTPLFDRGGRKARLTDAGRVLLPSAERMLALRREARALLGTTPSLVGTCRFGVSELGAMTWLPSFVSLMRRQHPALRLELAVDLGRHLERRVSRGELDCAVVSGLPERPGMAYDVIDDVGVTWSAAPARVQSGSVLDIRTLESIPIILMNEGSGLTQAFDAWSAGLSLRMPRAVTSNSLMAIVGLTMADVGLSILPTKFARPWTARGQLVAFGSAPPLPNLTFCFLHRGDDGREMLPNLRTCVMQVIQYETSSVLPGAGRPRVVGL